MWANFTLYVNVILTRGRHPFISPSSQGEIGTHMLLLSKNAPVISLGHRMFVGGYF